MIVVGAKGLAKEILEVFARRNKVDDLFFFDNVSTDLPSKLFGRFPILRSIEEVKQVFKQLNDSSFVLGLGNPLLRYRMTKMFEGAGGSLCSVISTNSEVGSFDTEVGTGTIILGGSVLTNSVRLGKGCLVNPNVSISHDSKVGDYVELSPGARVTGNCNVGNFCVLGTNAVIFPRVTLGTNVVVGAGAVVTKDVPDNSLVVGVPGIVKKKLPSLILNSED